MGKKVTGMGYPVVQLVLQGDQLAWYWASEHYLHII